MVEGRTWLTIADEMAGVIANCVINNCTKPIQTKNEMCFTSEVSPIGREVGLVESILQGKNTVMQGNIFSLFSEKTKQP